MIIKKYHSTMIETYHTSDSSQGSILVSMKSRDSRQCSYEVLDDTPESGERPWGLSVPCPTPACANQNAYCLFRGGFGTAKRKPLASYRCSGCGWRSGKIEKPEWVRIFDSDKEKYATQPRGGYRVCLPYANSKELRLMYIEDVRMRAKLRET